MDVDVTVVRTSTVHLDMTETDWVRVRGLILSGIQSLQQLGNTPLKVFGNELICAVDRAIRDEERQT
jgi:hypothetical protein